MTGNIDWSDGSSDPEEFI
jgi:hypothetical protein